MKNELYKRIGKGLVTPAALAALLIGVALGWGIAILIAPRATIGGVLYQSTSKYQFIDPLLACEVGTENSFPELNPIQRSLSDAVAGDIRTGKATQASVYFRFLKTAHWISVNPDQTYAPASLLKVFVMMAYYKESRDLGDPKLLQKQILFETAVDNPQATDAPGADFPHLVNHQSYSIQEVIKQMIVYSDNDALATLVDNFDPQTSKSLSEMFSDLQIDRPLTSEQEYLMPVEQYAMVFRVLYGSTYLSRSLSEQALSLLSQAQYRGALVSGVPSDVTVSHKFGITTLPATDTAPALHELHDCGIVYYPGQPYLLCIMTQGTDFPALQTMIQDLSRTAYQEVDKMENK